MGFELQVERLGRGCKRKFKPLSSRLADAANARFPAPLWLESGQLWEAGPAADDFGLADATRLKIPAHEGSF